VFLQVLVFDDVPFGGDGATVRDFAEAELNGLFQVFGVFEEGQELIGAMAEAVTDSTRQGLELLVNVGDLIEHVLIVHAGEVTEDGLAGTARAYVGEIRAGLRAEVKNENKEWAAFSCPFPY